MVGKKARKIYDVDSMIKFLSRWVFLKLKNRCFFWHICTHVILRYTRGIVRKYDVHLNWVYTCIYIYIYMYTLVMSAIERFFLSTIIWLVSKRFLMLGRTLRNLAPEKPRNLSMEISPVSQQISEKESEEAFFFNTHHPSKKHPCSRSV